MATCCVCFYFCTQAAEAIENERKSDKARVIQRAWRRYRANQEYLALMEREEREKKEKEEREVGASSRRRWRILLYSVILLS
jgi:hypothetical protein